MLVIFPLVHPLWDIYWPLRNVLLSYCQKLGSFLIIIIIYQITIYLELITPTVKGDVAIASHISLNTRLLHINPILRQYFISYKMNVICVKFSNFFNQSPISFWSCYIPNDQTIPPDLWSSLFQLRMSTICWRL